MQRIPVEHEPDPFRPSISIRSRREQNARDTTNARHVEQWLTDGPVFKGHDISLDTQGLSSRLKRESLDRHPQYQGTSEIVSNSDLMRQVTESVASIQRLESRIRSLPAGPSMDTAVRELKSMYVLHDTLVQAQKSELANTMGQNPYFDKYDIASDSRNVARELRSVVYEDVADRGVDESKKLLGRAFENRWIPGGYAKETGLNRVEAFELLRPTITTMSTTYNI
jgi:hypothetical protein